MGQEGKALGEGKRGGVGRGGGRCLSKQVAATPTRVPAWLEEDGSAFCLVRDERQTEADKEGDTKGEGRSIIFINTSFVSLPRLRFVILSVDRRTEPR